MQTSKVTTETLRSFGLVEGDDRDGDMAIAVIIENGRIVSGKVEMYSTFLSRETVSFRDPGRALRTLRRLRNAADELIQELELREALDHRNQE